MGPELAAELVLLTGAYPLGRAWRAHRRSSLAHALAWAGVAWLAWLGVALAAALGWGAGELARYLALCLTACAGVAVLGARRPGAAAWHFVVLGLLVVLLLPVAQGLGRLRLFLPHLLFVAGVLAVGLLNYLPTRLGPAAVLMTTGCGAELWVLAWEPLDTTGDWGLLALAAAPWAAYLAVLGGESVCAFDRTWRRFRDGFGALWGQRLREQFNRAAANAGLCGRLGWGGLRSAPEAERERLLATLRALLKRFGPAEEAEPPSPPYSGARGWG